jgi:hypothetical protein
MKIGSKNGRTGDDNLNLPSGPSGGITAANYLERGVAFIRGHGGEGFVIRSYAGTEGAWASGKPATEAQFQAWMNYLAKKQIPRAFAERRGMTTVPCEWPSDFDYEAENVDRSPMEPPPRPERGSLERRRYVVAEEMAKIEAAMALNPDRIGARKPPPDIRGIPEGPERAALQQQLDADIARQTERNQSTPIAPLGAWRGDAKKPGDAA